ncbi:ExbD/TolR family protein [Arenibacterium sp. LLYu02]|uniref:ExbD/TolR family protein n=1 Tax=Arenibacterium sp. LLYu02 TaxID=3404132 RepID=UPI003B20CAD2
MRLRRPKSGFQGEPITALIDVVFFLLVFFMLIGRMDATAPFEVEPPLARSGQDLPAGGLTLSLSASGDLALDGRPMSEDEVEQHLAQSATGAPPLPRLRINAHRQAELRHLLPLIAKAEALGFDDISLIVTPPSPRAEDAR